MKNENINEERATTKRDEAAEEWLASQKEPTCRYYRSWFKRFAEFTKMSGDEILASRRVDKEYLWEKKTLAFRQWLSAEKKLGDYTVTAMTMSIRGFFAYHRVPLQYRRTESKRLSMKKRKTEDYRFSLSDLKKLYDVADLNEKYVLTAGKSFGLRAGDFLRLTRGDVAPYIEREPPISIGELNTAKENVKAFPFIDVDAQPVVKLMLEKLTREGKSQPQCRILPYLKEIQLTRILKRLVAKAGVDVGSKQVRFHCLRKFLIDRLSSFMSESKWKQIVGKAISEGAYVSPDSLRADYERAMSELTFTRSALQEDRVRELAREELKASLTPEQKELIAKSGVKLRRKEHVSEPPKDCTDGEHCENFEQISETDLLAYLKDGWQIVKELASGEVIVRRT
jgi:integrase